MRSQVIKRSIVVDGHRTSVSLEDAFWQVLGRVAAGTGTSLSALVSEIDRQRAEGANLSSSIRLFLLDQALSGQMSARV